jgi:hypothetical protein
MAREYPPFSDGTDSGRMPKWLAGLIWLSADISGDRAARCHNSRSGHEPFYECCLEPVGARSPRSARCPSFRASDYRARGLALFPVSTEPAAGRQNAWRLKPARRFLRSKFPVNGWKFPVLRNFFPVNLRRELTNKSLQHSGFSLQHRPLEPQNRKIPC